MKGSKTLLAAVLFAGSVFAASAQKAKIDFRYNVLQNDSKNYLNWSADGKNVKDSFDAATGASKAQSTTAFNSIRFDATGKAKASPAGLRALMLYPVASRDTAEGDNLNVTANGKQLVIRFIHRGTPYEITTDGNGMIDLTGSFKSSSPVADNKGGKFIFKDEFLKSGGDNTKAADVDWTKITLSADTADANAGYKYSGTLKAEYKSGILTIAGTISK